MSLLYLIRHGQASAGTHDYDRLSEVGHEQSRLLGQWWGSQGFEPAAIHYGTLKRQRETAHGALEGMGLTTDHVDCQSDKGLNEYDHRVIETFFAHESSDDTPESLTFEEYLGIMQRWRDHKLTGASAVDTPEFETFERFKQRGWSTVRQIMDSNNRSERIAFFTSGGIIATILSSILDLDFEHMVDAIWRIRNSSITTLHYNGERTRLVEFNTIPHLQTEHKPSLITLI
ncbi:MAG: histidine phosphatase family protein [Granulosicoccus sp.]|nr:histidine phosphatase family protein [Granulosicoccus sp.]